MTEQLHIDCIQSMSSDERRDDLSLTGTDEILIRKEHTRLIDYVELADMTVRHV